MLFALALIMAGAFAFAGGSTSASAMTAGAVTGMNDIVKPSQAEKVTYYGYGYRRGYCYHYPWRCRGYYYRHRPYWRHHHHRRHYWRHRRHYW
jgi:hypothetical protein